MRIAWRDQATVLELRRVGDALAAEITRLERRVATLERASGARKVRRRTPRKQVRRG